ncbi:target of EGR1 protein 1 isoform X3 [Chiloscyllium plagiosum]|uniref:target of EGR1 protein 1 isoform X3 n=1 Tax=Chiloscyllium plagiosum TaxID=36176 RepID=UPI001CB7C60F|nr:target of EGR1 protein 1 isoform X3 [Chiloscyllium plagiosum]
MEVFSFCNLMKMAFTKVPVVDVHIDNFKEVWPSMLLAVRTASFIALDTELSGLGTRKALLAQSIEDRYKAICNAARTRSVLSLGIASFKELSHKPNECRGQNMRGLFLEIIQSKKPLILHNGLIDLTFLYQCFYANLPDQLMTFTADVSEMFPAGVYDTKYTSEVETRFVSSYLEYAYKKCRRENNRLIDASNSHLSIEFCNYQQAFTDYIDYRCCNLPEADKKVTEEGICERFSAYGWCPNGMKCSLSHNTDLIIEEDERNNDKKKKKVRRKRKQNTAELTDNPTNCMFADNVTPTDIPPSKLLCDNASMEQKREIIGELMQEKSASDTQLPKTTFEEESKDNPCGVMDTEEKILSNNKKENHPEGQECTGTKLVEKSKIEKCEGGTHRAGFDAFMTGFIMAYILMWKNGESSSTKMDPWLPDCHNKLYLSGKTLPLQICKSSFSKSSKVHQAKIELLWGKQ